MVQITKDLGTILKDLLNDIKHTENLVKVNVLDFFVACKNYVSILKSHTKIKEPSLIYTRHKALKKRKEYICTI